MSVCEEKECKMPENHFFLSTFVVNKIWKV